MHTLIFSLYLAFIGVVFCAVLHFSIRCSSGQFKTTKVSDFVLTISCVALLCFLPWADIIDAISLIIYCIVILYFRFNVLKRVLQAQEMVLHLAMLYLSLSRLDKVYGYGDINDFITVLQYILIVTIVVNCIYLIIKRIRLLPVITLFLLIFPVSHLPLELIRNVVAREVSNDALDMYVTKLYVGDMYGIPFEKTDSVKYLSKINGHFQLAGYHFLHGWEGTLEPQTPMFSYWEWSLVKWTFAGSVD